MRYSSAPGGGTSAPMPGWRAPSESPRRACPPRCACRPAPSPTARSRAGQPSRAPARAAPAARGCHVVRSQRSQRSQRQLPCGARKAVSALSVVLVVQRQQGRRPRAPFPYICYSIWVLKRLSCPTSRSNIVPHGSAGYRIAKCWRDLESAMSCTLYPATVPGDRAHAHGDRTRVPGWCSRRTEGW